MSRRNPEPRDPGPKTLPDAVRQGHEPERTSVKYVALAGAGLLAMVLGTMVLMYALTVYWAGQRPPVERTALITEFEQVTTGVQPNQRLLRTEIQMEELRRLRSYGWVDKKNGVAHIPVDRAIELLIERGLPFSEQNNAPRTLAEEEPSGASTSP